MSEKDREEDNAHILTRLAARESSTLAFAAVAASSSLIVLALTIQSKTSWWIEWIGLFFAGIGILYRELTFFFSDLPEFGLLSERLQKRLRNARNEWSTQARRVIVRMFLWLPVVAWLILMWQLEISPLSIQMLFVLFFLISMAVTALQFAVEESRRTTKS